MILEPPASFSSLPDEITENILARVSRWNYPRLSLVSKKFRSLLSSMEIYKMRSQIGAKETCVYVCLQLPNQPYPSWFSLWSKPSQTLITERIGKIGFKQNPRGNSVVLVPFSSSSHSPPIPINFVQVGSDIYIIGGHPYMEPSSSVGIFDCRNHTWRDNVPNMTVARIDQFVVYFDEKIYVVGGCDIDEYSANWIEVFDIKTQSWTALPGPGDNDEETRDQLRQHEYCYIVHVNEGKFYLVVDEMEFTYEPKDGTWKVIKEHSSFLSTKMWCWIENVVYCYTHSGYLMWSEPNDWEWREIKGLENLLEHGTRGLRTGRILEMDNYGGKLLVMWDPYPNRKTCGIKIWYAMISLESR